MKKIKLNTVYNIDARKITETLSSEIKIQTTITSPPYFDMKDYNSENQVGYGQTYENYLNDLKDIFEGIYKVTADNGTLWIIIDTFKRNNQVITLPFDLSDRLKQIGWLLQDVIIWKKDKTVPWSNNGFMQRKFEYILFFSKNKTFKSNKDSVRVYDTSQLKRWWIKYPERYNPKGKALDEVWEFPIPVQGSWGDEYVRHFCPLPKEMVATMIQISTDENDLILDPFAGSGTVLSQSAYMKRKYIGFETNKTYIEMFKKYLKHSFKTNSKEYELLSNSSQGYFEKMILDLRALKYARVLIASLSKKADLNLNSDFKVIVEPSKEPVSKKNKIVKVKYILIIGNTDKEKLWSYITECISKKPLSKFGIEPIFKLVKAKKVNYNNSFGYTKTNTYSYVKEKFNPKTKMQIFSSISVDLDENDYH